MIKTVEPNSTCNLPLHVVHTGTSELFFGVSGYSITSNSFAWKNLHLNLAMAELLECRPKDKKRSKNGFFIQVNMISFLLLQVLAGLKLTLWRFERGRISGLENRNFDNLKELSFKISISIVV